MKIFQAITVSEYGGAQSVVTNLAQSLHTQNQVFILYGGEGEAWGSLGDNYTGIRFGKHRKKISLADLGLFFKLIYYRFKYKPDIVHLHSSKIGILGRLAFSKKKTILTLHGFDSVRLQHRKFLPCEKTLQHKVGKIVAVSQYDVLGMEAENITKNVCCIYNGVPDYMHRQVDYNPVILDKLNDIKGRFSKVAMCIARISSQKRFDIFLETASLLPEYAFVWIGNKEEFTSLPDNVFCLGETSSAQIYLNFADVFILPSNYEGLPMSLLEAMSFGKPIVASAVGGITEVMQAGNGFAIENNPEIFAEKIKYILSDNEVYKSISDKSREQYLEKFTIEKMVQQYAEIYDELIKNK